MGNKTSTWALVIVMAACAGSERERRRSYSFGPTTAELSERLEDFDQAMKKGELDAAAKILTELERGIEEAPVATITHPDYMRISAAVDRAAESLETARGGKSFSGWQTSAREAIAVADRLTDELKTRVTKQQYAALGRVAQRLERLVIAGEAYRGEPQFSEVAEPLEARLITCGELQQSLRWQIEVRAALAGPLGDAEQAEKALALAPADQRRRLTASMMAGFKSCAAVASLHAGRVGANAAPLPTPYGQLPIRELQALCSRRAAAAAEQLEALREPPPAPPPAPVQDAATATAATADAEDTTADAGALPAIDLDAVSKNTVISDVHGDLTYAEQEIERAGTAGHAAERVVAFANSLVAFHRCASRADTLLAQLRNLAPDAQNALTALGTRCRLQATRVERLLAETSPID